jgi:hypothetical protein
MCRSYPQLLLSRKSYQIPPDVINVTTTIASLIHFENVDVRSQSQRIIRLSSIHPIVQGVPVFCLRKQ